MESRLTKVVFTVSLFLMGTANAQECYGCRGAPTEECLREQDANSTIISCVFGICDSTNYTAETIGATHTYQIVRRSCALPGAQTGCTDDTAEIERREQLVSGNQSLPFRILDGRQCHCSGNLCNNMSFELPANVQTQQECYHCFGGTDITGTTIASTDECLREQDSNSSTMTCQSGICVFSNYSLESSTSSDGSVVNPRVVSRTCGPPGTQIGCIDDAAEIQRLLQQSSGDTTLRIRAGRQCYCSGDLCNSMPVEFSNAAWMRPDISLLAYMIIALVFHAF